MLAWAQIREFEEFFLAGRRRTLMSVLPLVRDIGEGEDVVQIAYERAARHWGTIRSYEDPGGWVRRVARNEAISCRRRTQRRPVAYVPDMADVAGHHWDVHHDHTSQVLLALRRLTRPDQVVLTLRYFHDVPPQEIAAELGVSVNTVKTRLKRAKRRLAAAIDPM